MSSQQIHFLANTDHDNSQTLVICSEQFLFLQDTTVIGCATQLIRTVQAIQYCVTGNAFMKEHTFQQNTCPDFGYMLRTIFFSPRYYCNWVCQAINTYSTSYSVLRYRQCLYEGTHFLGKYLPRLWLYAQNNFFFSKILL